MDIKDSAHPDKRYYDLAEKWRNGTITPQEEKEFSEWYNHSQDAPVIIPASFASSEEQLKSRIWKRIQKGRKGRITTLSNRTFYRIAAAVVVAAVALGIYFNEKTNDVQRNVQHRIARSPIDTSVSPDRAILILGDGTQVSLDDAGNGTISQQGSTRVIKLVTGQLSYQAGEAKDHPEKSNLNTIRTPRGGKYEVILPDQTRVWLNASSSIRFPTSFTGREREINLSGEAYFEVAKNKGMPFIVKLDKMKVMVLGTHFNVMAYKEEQEVKTTLLEGSVEVSSGNMNTKLNPGQQAQLKEGTFKLIKHANIEEVMAWKKGEFHFESTELKTIMRQIERWYDVKIVYEGDLSGIRLSGIISQKKDVAQLLEILQATHEIKCRLEGSTVVVGPYK